jgi:hypothetical protein
MLLSWPIKLLRSNRCTVQYSITVSATGNIAILGPVPWKLTKGRCNETFAPVEDKYMTFLIFFWWILMHKNLSFNKNVNPVYTCATDVLHTKKKNVFIFYCWVVNYTCIEGRSKKIAKLLFSWIENGITAWNNIPLSIIISVVKVQRNSIQMENKIHEIYISDAKHKSIFHAKRSRDIWHKWSAVSYRFLLSDKSHMCVCVCVQHVWYIVMA